MCNKKEYFIEMTDAYDSEPNYSWVRRYKTRAISERGALQKLQRRHGYRWRKTHDDGESVSYLSNSGCTFCFITEWADEYHENCLHVETL